ncbi:MAG: hypothetical protein ACPL4E_03080 [Thermoproteota archaeon]
MGDAEYHARIAREKREGAIDELGKGRFSNVADLALKAVEQAIEAAASRNGLHFHKNPRSAHAERAAWLKRNFPGIGATYDLLWGSYGLLGYDGIDGERAAKVVEAMEVIMNEVASKTRIRLK